LRFLLPTHPPFGHIPANTAPVAKPCTNPSKTHIAIAPGFPWNQIMFGMNDTLYVSTPIVPIT
jgi:hypothetical protein